MKVQLSVTARKDEEVEGNAFSVDNYGLDKGDGVINDKEDTTASNGLPELDFSGDVLEKMRALEDRVEQRIKCIKHQVHEMKGREETLSMSSPREYIVFLLKENANLKEENKELMQSANKLKGGSKGG